MKSTPATLATLLGLLIPLTAPALTNVSGNLQAEARRLEDFSRNSFGPGSNTYVAPTAQEWTNFQAAAAQVFQGNIAQADILAAALGYEVVRFTHTNSGALFFELRAQETNGVPVKGWGSYILSTNFLVNALVEAPHPQFDFRSPGLAADAFVKSGARGLLIAGAHRNVNGTGTADPCDLTNTAFHAVHEAWNGPSGEITAWQVHGFSMNNHPEFPADTLAVLSTGQSGTNHFSPRLIALDQQLESRGIKAYAYGKFLATNDPLNLAVNEGVDPLSFTNLGAQSNIQGDHSRGLGGAFVHAEFATLVRTNGAWAALAGDALAAAIQAIPEPGPLVLLLLGGVAALAARGRLRA